MRVNFSHLAFVIVLLGHVLLVYGLANLNMNKPAVAVEDVVMQGVLLAAPMPIAQPIKEPVKKKKPVPPKKKPPETPKPVPEETVEEVKPEPAENAINLEQPVEEPVAEPEQAAAPEPEVIPPKMDALNLDNPAPNYPNISRRLNEQGTVILEILILPDGTVGEIRLKTSSGYKRLDNVALNAVKQWRYVPARRGTEAISYWYLQPVKFALN